MKPILFNTAMVQAILDERKTVTRRVVKPRNPVKAAKMGGYHQGDGLWIDGYKPDDEPNGHIKDYSVSSCWWRKKDYIERYAPYKPGDILYVRETWSIVDKVGYLNEPYYIFRADYEDEQWPTRWHPSTHMPREAARIFLRVTDVRVERLQDITEEQAVAEGVFLYSPDFIPTYHWKPQTTPGNGWTTAKECFLWGVWNSTIKPADMSLYGWKANPWVWIYEFERIEKP